MMITIDLVIPSYRLQEEILLGIIDLPRPSSVELSIFIIADNPQLTIPDTLIFLHEEGRVHLVANQANLGFSASRNKGIRLGSGKYVLLLDDDIVPHRELLFAYAEAIVRNPDAIGYAGVTLFPTPFNPLTKALDISGTTHHFSLPATQSKLRWTPTANVMLNRRFFSERWFDESLKYGGEDIALLASRSIETGEQFVAAPGAIVYHPWWNKGRSQLKRMYRYGIGAADILADPVLRKYSWLDFTNTIESIFLLLIATPFLTFWGHGSLLLMLMLVVMLSEWIVCYARCIKESGNYHPAIATQLMLHKMARETGMLFGWMRKGRWQDFTRRVDVGFSKPHPSPYRLNRWKIFKSFLILGGILLLIAIGAAG